jgi:glycine betaine/proline transport system substrate-binding protein
MEPPPEPVPRSDTATGEDGQNPRTSARGACQDLSKLKDDDKLFGEGNTIRTVANEKFPERYPQLTKWIKNFRMSEGELGSLESSINQRGQGHEEEAVAAWLKRHPDMVSRMTPR